VQQPNEKVKWLLDARFGMFIHWGLYAGPAKGEWYMENSAVPIEEYRKLAYPESGDEYFSADKFNADEWAALAKAAGMKYMCLTAMHHDGFALFDSRYINAFTSKQTLNRDFVKEYTDACRKAGLKVGLYKTLINWRYPGYFDVSGMGAKKNNWGYVTDISHKENAREMKEGLYYDVKKLMTDYGKIDLIFWDGGWLGQQGTDADAAYFWEPGKYLDTTNQWPINKFFQDTDPATGKPLGIMGIVRKYQPDIVVNPRSAWMGDYMSEEGGAPITGPVRSKEIWQKCMTLGGAWGYTAAMEDSTKLISFNQLKRMLADVVIRNMSLLLNVGPDRHGVISRPVTHLLQQTGNWLHDREEAVYGTFGGPWNPKDGQYGFAYRDSTIYVFLLDNFKSNAITLPAINKGQRVMKVYEVGRDSKLRFSQNKNRGITIHFPNADDNIRIFAVRLNEEVLNNE
jgi:alpha-L-fucosidase